MITCVTYVTNPLVVESRQLEAMIAERFIHHGVFHPRIVEYATDCRRLILRDGFEINPRIIQLENDTITLLDITLTIDH